MKFANVLKVAAVVLGLLILAAFPALSQQGSQEPSQDVINHGRYLTVVGGCGDCHTPKNMTERGPVPDSTRLLSGHPGDQKLPEIPAGVVGPGKWGAVGSPDFTAWYGPWGVSFAMNLTPDNATGIGAWTEASFIKAMKTGKHMGAGRQILPPMPWENLSLLEQKDLAAIFHFLKSIPPVQNEVPLPIPPAPMEQKK